MTMAECAALIPGDVVSIPYAGTYVVISNDGKKVEVSLRKYRSARIIPYNTMATTEIVTVPIFIIK